MLDVAATSEQFRIIEISVIVLFCSTGVLLDLLTKAVQQAALHMYW